MHVMTKPWKHPRSGIFYLRREVPEDIRQIIGKREWKVSLRTRDFAAARPRFASELIRCEDIFFAAREQLAGRPRVLASDAPSSPIGGRKLCLSHGRASRRISPTF